MPAPNTGLPAPWSSHVQRLLVADSDESVVASARQLLASYPCDIDWAQNDVEALAMIDAASPGRRYDVILVDLPLALKSDSALLPLVQTAGQRLPIVLTCQLGYDKGVSLVKARSMGLAWFLYKPLVARQLFEVIGRVVESGRSRLP